MAVAVSAAATEETRNWLDTVSADRDARLFGRERRPVLAAIHVVGEPYPLLHNTKP